MVETDGIMAGTGQQRRRQPRMRGAAAKPDGPAVQWNRRIYDPRRWHKRSGSSHGADGSVNGSNAIAGQPPAGWMLVWAGRFKRWRRRWFVAHPPGLLLYYKTSDQIGRPGNISLLGASVVPVAGKDRQFKIVKGSSVYYLRTLNRDFRQAWVDTVRESVDTYNKSVQKAQIGVPPGRHVLPQHQSLPPHLGEEWEEQERELNRRLSSRLQEIEPARHAFLQQLHTLQHSLSAICGALGLTNQSPIKKASSSGSIIDPSVPSVSQVHADILGSEGHFTPATETSNRSLGVAESSTTSALGASREKASKSIFRPWKGESDNRPRESTSTRLRSAKSGPTVPLSADSNAPRNRRRSLSFSVDETVSTPRCVCQGNCLCVERINFRRGDHGQTPRNGHFSDPEVSSGLEGSKGVQPVLSTILSSDSEQGFRSTQPETEDGSSLNNTGEMLTGKEGLSSAGFNKAGTSEGRSSELYINGSKTSSKEASASVARVPSEQDGIKHQERREKNDSVRQSPLQGAWNSLMDAFSEVLREEVHRVLDLEAENAVLQDSLAMLPDLQRDRIALTHLREQLKKDPRYAGVKFGEGDGEDGDDEEDGEETEDEASMLSSDVTNEEYFEALEVLNQYDFVAKATPSAEQEGLAEGADLAAEPPEEGDLAGDTDILSEAETEELNLPRTRLPAPRPLNRGFSLWTVLKNAVGKDLNRITMPATINEPLSVLQRSAEEMQYRDLLETASQCEDSLERLLWVSAFACSTYHGSIHRDAKPFNPLLGETYEWLAPDGRAWFLAEQVSHHPPVMAFQCESKPGEFVVYGEIEIRNKFWGKSVEIIPTGLCHLRFQKHRDHFTWNKVTTCVHNVVVGKLWIDNYGELVVRNHTTGEHSRTRFLKATGRERCRISGKVYDSAGVPRYSLYGSYMDKIFGSSEPSANPGASPVNARCLWTCPEPPEDFRQQYCFTTFTIGLNELTPRLAEALPPTDSRLRPDQRALEEGDLEKATPEKLRLEDKQRNAQKARKTRNEEWRTMWFQQRVPGGSQVKVTNDGEEPSWVYQHKYWETRERRAWEICPDIM